MNFEKLASEVAVRVMEKIAISVDKVKGVLDKYDSVKNVLEHAGRNAQATELENRVANTKGHLLARARLKGVAKEIGPQYLKDSAGVGEGNAFLDQINSDIKSETDKFLDNPTASQVPLTSATSDHTRRIADKMYSNITRKK